MEEYKEYQTINTPLGKLNIYVDGNLINYLPIKIRYEHPSCKDKPIAACYRIYGNISKECQVKCVIETTEDVEYSPESGEEYICTTLTKDNIMLTIGTKDPSYGEIKNYIVKHTENGLVFTDFSGKNEIIIGVAWVNDTDEWDVRTWYAADPTLDK